MEKDKTYTPLEEKIYMICFSKPRYPAEIQNLLTKSGRNTQPSQLLVNNKKSILTKLIKKEWLIEIKNKEKKQLIDRLEDGRSKNRRYFQSNINPLIDYFNSLIKLEKNEKRQLRHLFEKKNFIQFLSWENGFKTFNQVKEFLVQFTLWEYISIKYTDPYRLKNKDLINIDQKNLLNELVNQILYKRNRIAERIAPDLKIEFTKEKKESIFNYIDDISNKLKPPLFNKIIQLSHNRFNLFDMAITTLACGEFMSEFNQNKNKHKI